MVSQCHDILGSAEISAKEFLGPMGQALSGIGIAQSSYSQSTGSQRDV